MKLSLSSSADMTSKSSVRNAISVLENILKVLDGLLEVQTLDSSSGLIGVLEVSSQIGNSALSGYMKIEHYLLLTLGGLSGLS